MSNNSISNVSGSPGEGSFCERYLDVAGDLAGVGKWFLIVALALGVVAVVIKAYLDLHKPAGQPVKRDGDGVPALWSMR